ncbi:MAG: EF-P lysine aminoacylase GenX [Gammaproteobacteria bacterium]|nr:EF-P lysine aminoacylase GenX [Gammaproteobacteria bacterium]
MGESHWQPRTGLDNIRRRAEVLEQVRSFFSEKGVLEVETPLLSRYTVTDPFISSIEIPKLAALEGASTYLQTSPEYAMKRILAAYGAELDGVFQICKAFRNDASSVRHNPEFTMLEWYRLGFSMQALMAEVEDLLRVIYAQQGHKLEIRHQSYQSLFEEVFSINPHRADRTQLQTLAAPWLPADSSGLDKKDLLDLLFSFGIEPVLVQYPAIFVSDYPESMSALAQLKVDGKQGFTSASRFELYLNGLEVANGYHELLEPAEHLTRFEADQHRREILNLPAHEIDPRFMAAIESGLPDCSGVALGLDRLLMVLSQQPIGGVISFPTLDA